MRPKRLVPAAGIRALPPRERSGGSETCREDLDLSTDLTERSDKGLTWVYFMPKSKIPKGGCKDAIAAEASQSKKALEGSRVHGGKGGCLRTPPPWDGDG